MGCIIAVVMTSQAQVELRVNPLGFLSNSNFHLSAEIGASSHLGIEPFLGTGWMTGTKGGGFGFTTLQAKGLLYGFNNKYYFNPKNGIDKFYMGLYLRGGKSKTEGEPSQFFAVGVSTGYKWLYRQHFVFDLGIGLGKRLINKYTLSGSPEVSNSPADGFLRFDVGYRFGNGS